MLIISHRGRLNGAYDPNSDNFPGRIYYILEHYPNLGIEIDVRYGDGLYLGHDEPKYKVGNLWDILFKYKDKIFIHAKDFDAAKCLSYFGKELNWFVHDNSFMTFTSKGDIWCYPNHEIDDSRAILMNPQETTENIYLYWPNIKGICTDNPLLYL